MKSCEKVCVLISLYQPNMNYLKGQLESINAQDYENIEVLLWDDYPQSDLTEEKIGAWITRFPFQYIRCQENLGYIKAFEQLTGLARGKYIAYCDQDDVWHPHKISACVQTLQKENAVFVTCDRREIDANGKELIASNKKQRPDITSSWETGDDITAKAAFGCFAPGFTIMVETEVAQKIMPFPLYSGHDMWITLCASVMGKVAFCNEVLADYRRHGNNVTGMFNGVTSKKDYLTKRIQPSFKLAQEFIKRFPTCPANSTILALAKARCERNPFKILKYKSYAPKVAWFESVTAWMPDFLFRWVIKMIAG